MKIKPTTAFRILSSARRKRADSIFSVKSLNKDGSVSKMKSFETFLTVEEAEHRRIQLESLNPGKRFTTESTF